MKMPVEVKQTVTKVPVHRFIVLLADHVGVTVCAVCRTYADSAKQLEQHICQPVPEEQHTELVVSKEMASNTFQWEKGKEA